MKAWQHNLGAGITAAMMMFGAAGAAAAENGSAEDFIAPDELEGSIWFSEREHRRVTVTTCGDIEVKEGKNIYIRFLERVDDIFVIEVRWWNEQQGLNVLEHGVLTQIEPNEYFYVEADHEDARRRRDQFPGIIGQGTFELLSKDEAKVIQLGNLIDGSASAFTTTVTRVDHLPEAPIDQSYPRFCPS